MQPPLDGIKVLDFTRFQNGPHATVMLSDLGAEVLKVERPGEGDPGRSLGRRPDGFCGYFEALDRGKRSITLDLGAPEAREVIYRLIEEGGYDVVTENFRPHVMDSLGLGYEDLRARNPRLIYAANTGFGMKGEWADRGSFDIVSQGMSGAMLGQAESPEGPPVQAPWGLADQVGSMVFAYAILGAVVARERYGVGQRVDSSQLGAMMTLQALSVVGFLHTGQQNPRFVNPTFTAYLAGDGRWLTIGILTPKHWTPLCIALGRDDLLTDERSATPFGRMQNRDWMCEQLAESFKSRPRDEWLQLLCEQEVPCGPVHDYAGVVADRQVWDNGYLVELEHPHFEGHRTVGVPYELSETPARVQGPAPELGQHTEAVLLDLGYDWERITALRDRGVI